MCEERIFYLLTQLKSNTKSDLHVQESTLNESFIQNACKNLSELLSNTNKEKSFNRSQYIEFLRNYCKDCEGHLKVNGSNFEIFLESLEVAQEQDDPNVKKYVEDIDQKDSSNCFVKELGNFFTKRLEKYRNKQERLGYINASNQRGFKDSFDFIPSKKLENYSENLQVIQKFKIKDISQDKISPALHVHKRDSQIKLGYSVLNLNSIHKDTIVTNILNRLESYEELKASETRFVQDYFKKALFLKDGHKCKELLKSFTFIIEFPVIDLTELAFNDFDLKNSPNFHFLESVIALDDSFKVVVLDIIYELYSLSNYCDKVLKLIEIIKVL